MCASGVHAPPPPPPRLPGGREDEHHWAMRDHVVRRLPQQTCFQVTRRRARCSSASCLATRPSATSRRRSAAPSPSFSRATTTSSRNGNRAASASLNAQNTWHSAGATLWSWTTSVRRRCRWIAVGGGRPAIGITVGRALWKGGCKHVWYVVAWRRLVWQPKRRRIVYLTVPTRAERCPRW